MKFVKDHGTLDTSKQVWSSRNISSDSKTETAVKRYNMPVRYVAERCNKTGLRKVAKGISMHKISVFSSWIYAL